MSIAFEGGGAKLNEGFNPTATATFSAGTNAARAILAWATQESDNTPTINSVAWNGNNLSLGADHDPNIPPGTTHSVYGSLVNDSLITTGSQNLVETMSNGNAKPRVIGGVWSGVGSMQNQTYYEAASTLTPSFVVNGSNGDLATLMLITDGSLAISVTSSGGVIRASGTSGAYEWAIIDQPISGTSTTISLLTTGAAPSWSGVGASLTPSGGAAAASDPTPRRAFPMSILLH